MLSINKLTKLFFLIGVINCQVPVIVVLCTRLLYLHFRSTEIQFLYPCINGKWHVFFASTKVTYTMRTKQDINIDTVINMESRKCYKIIK